MHGERITFWGWLGTQSVFQCGSPSRIREEIARLCSETGRKGGYILAPAKPLQPGIPLEKAIATVEAFVACNRSCIAARNTKRRSSEEKNG
jgi:hypothetical protein